MFRLLSSAAALAVAALAVSADAAGVCYSPFYSSDYTPGNVASLLTRDFKTIAAQGFDSVRTYHAQFYGQNVVDAAVASGLKIAIGIQMVGENGGEYAYLEKDIQAAIAAATSAPQNVIAIYAGNENLKSGSFGYQSGDQIVSVINRVKSALKGTAGEGVPVGTVQRLEEWLNAGDAAKVAAACDVVGANIYPFFTLGGAVDMKGTLNRQWSQFASKYGGKARLTETGWPSEGSTYLGNVASTDNAAKYFAAFNDWASQTSTQAPFYFMMFDVPTAPGANYEQHFGVATSSNVMKFNAAPAKNEATELRDFVPATVGTLVDPLTPVVDNLAAPLVAPTPEPTTDAPTPVPTTVAPTPEPTTVAPTPEPTPEPTTVAPTSTPTPTPTPTLTPKVAPAPIAHHGSSSGSHDGGEDITFPSGSHATDHSKETDTNVGDGSAGVPEPTTHTVPTNAPTAPPADATPAVTTLSPQAQAELEAKEANSKVAREVSGTRGGWMTIGVGVVGCLGVAAIVVASVYMRRRNDSDSDNASETRTVAASSIDPRGSTPSVYDDPLGTRFSSIVMLTPNGDGVCIL